MSGFFREYTQIASESPDPQTTILVLDPCLKPYSLTSPGQATELEYDYNRVGARFLPQSLAVDPPICPLTFSCLSITGSDSNALQCDDQSGVLQVDALTGKLEMTTQDMVKYPPGEYLVTLQASAGTEEPVTVQIAFTLRLVDPCPSAQLSSLQASPFFSVSYTLGEE